VITDAQFGFRRGLSTVDALFALTSVVQKYLNVNKRLYCVFVDLKKAFDSVYRNALWLKLYRCGVQGKILRIIRDMYEKVKSCVRHCNTYTDYFECSVGLRQGEVISPLMFALFVEDLELHLQDNNTAGIHIDDVALILLLFADDMVILAKDVHELQYELDLLYSYCNNWGLEINVLKTKVMVFRKRGKLRQDEHWTYNGQQLEVVNDFNYLGVVFNYTGNFNLNQEHISGKALRALHVLQMNTRNLNISPKLLCQLFDSFVGSTLGYACEIWGFSKSKEIERIHLKFCKRLLGVRKNTCTVGVYGEVGRYPLYVARYVRIIKYWFKLITTDNIVLKTLYNQALNDCNSGCTNWVTNVKQLLSTYGFADVWISPGSVDSKHFYLLFKQRLIDCFVQSWFGDKSKSSTLDLYNNFKTTFIYEPYLDILPRNYRMYISRLRLSSHSLRIQTERFSVNRIPRNERYCLCCNSLDIEDEYHFILCCPCYSDLRKTYIKRYYYNKPSVYKLIQLLQTYNKAELYKLAKYLKESSNVRKAILNK
jgi:hypothetical protein